MTNKYPIIVSCLWILLISSLWFWSRSDLEHHLTTLAKKEAQERLESSLDYHGFLAMLGGIYVHPAENIQDDFFLELLEEKKEAVTTDGRKLILMNPAHFLRKMQEHIDQGGAASKARLISLHPTNSDNTPLQWEREALSNLADTKADSYFSLTENKEGRTVLRSMLPILLESSCLKCHRSYIPSFEPGQLRGGMSVVIDYAPYKEIFMSNIRQSSTIYSSIVLLGLVLIWVGWLGLKQYGDDLRRSEKRLRLLVDSSPDIILFEDGNGKWQVINKALRKLFPVLDSVEYKGKTCNEIFSNLSEEESASFREFYGRDEDSWQAGTKMCGRVELTGEDRRKRFFEITKIPIFTGDKLREGLLLVAKDISKEIRRNEKNQLLITAVKQAGEIIVITDRSGIIIYANPAFEKTTGFHLADAVGKTPGALLNSGEHDAGFFKKMWGTIEKGDIWQGLIQNRKKNGDLYTEEMTIAPVKNKKEEITHFIAIKKDISRQLQIEQEKDEAEAMAYRAQKMETIGRLAGGVAHDFNNLLTPILGYAEMLLRDPEFPQGKKENIEKIVLAGGKARDIVRQLLAVGKQQDGSVEPIEINRVLCDFRPFLEQSLRDDVQMELSLDPTGGWIMADKGRLEQVIMNLLLNAQDAMPDGGFIMLETRSKDLFSGTKIAGLDPGRYICLSLSDTGTGMSEELLDKVFEPFFTTKHHDRGTGLGLAMVYGTVRQFAGEIKVWSREGQGAVFSLYFPALDFVDTTERNSDENLPAPQASSGKNSILVVDDDVQVGSLTCAILEQAGHDVTVFTSSKSALKAITEQEQCPDLLISDMVMPEMNGKELYSRLLAIQPNLRVIYVSGYSDDILAIKDVRDLQVDFLQKPFTVDGLLAKVSEVLFRH